MADVAPVTVEEKREHEHVEALGPISTHIENEEISRLSEEHRQYLLNRHGHLDMDPVPDMSDADPYNWPQSRVCYLPGGSTD